MEAGTLLGPYEILEPLGAGGMGEVYRARDPRLERDVAIKVLPALSGLGAGDPDGQARFEREAKLLAQLNHPNIATIHGFEESGGVHFIAMELVEGESLAEWIAVQGATTATSASDASASGLEDVLQIARQVALALEAAHRAGVIHRDLKPANVQIAHDGVVKVLDFGLAKAYEVDVASATISPDITRSPTMAAATRAGLILGTAAYMSPEQARGAVLDERTDIWSFGCLLFELLAGQRPFPGATASDTMTSILKDEPDWELLPQSAALRRLLRRCLRKKPDARLHDIADARIEIDEILDGADEQDGATESSPGARAPMWRVALSWMVVAAMSLGMLGMALRRSPEPVEEVVPAPTRFTVTAPTSEELTLALSADGSQLVYTVTGEDGVSRLYLREMSSLEAEVVPQTEGARFPFFSPDGKWIGFYDGMRVVKVSLGGGAPFPIAGLENTTGASWGRDGRIVAQRGFGTGLVSVPEGGGEPTPITQIDLARGERHHLIPSILPGGRAALFTILRGISSERREVAVVSLESGEIRVLTSGRDARYAPSGHLLFMRRDALMAAPFSLETLTLEGEPAVIIGSVDTYGESRGLQGIYDIAANGTFVYVAEETPAEGNELVWVDREGNPELITEARHIYANPRLSPDGKLLLVSILEEDRFAVWVYSFERDTLTRITATENSSAFGVWHPDGTTLGFTSDLAGPVNVFR